MADPDLDTSGDPDPRMSSVYRWRPAFQADFAAHMETEDATTTTMAAAATAATATTKVESSIQTQSELFDDLVALNRDFWSTVYSRFMNRDLNRREMKTFVRAGLQAAQGNYRRLIGLLRLPDSDYQRFMDFLRHHDLKP